MKQRYSVFVGTLLGEMLREQSIRTVVLVGLTIDICVQQHRSTVSWVNYWLTGEG